MNEALINKLRDLISRCLNGANIELVDLTYSYIGRNLILRVLVSRTDGGITVGECALLNRKIGALLEEEKMIGSDYTLEVSSPGLDRPLKTQKDFSRCMNKEAVFFLNDLIDGKCQWQGKINKVSQDRVFVRTLENILEIPLEKINKAQLVI